MKLVHRLAFARDSPNAKREPLSLFVHFLRIKHPLADHRALLRHRLRVHRDGDLAPQPLALERLEQWSQTAAARLSDQIDAAERLIGANPGVGKDRSHFGPGYQSVTVGDYQLFFRATAAEVIVLRFLHGSRDLPAAVAEVDD